MGIRKSLDAVSNEFTGIEFDTVDRLDAIGFLAQYQANGGVIGFVAQLVVHHATIEVHLSGIFGFEIAAFEIDYHVAAQLEVIEEQVDVEILLADVEVVLSSDKGEALAQLQQKFFQMGDEAGFQLALMETRLQGEEIK